MQRQLNTVILGVGGLSHERWRAFGSERRPMTLTGEALRFIDGDLIESFLQLPRDKMQQVVAGLSIKDGDQLRPLTVEDISRVVDELSRRH